MRLTPFHLVWVSLTAGVLLGSSNAPWTGIETEKTKFEEPLSSAAEWQATDVHYLQSAYSPGILIRMKSPTIHFFTGLDDYGAEPPKLFWVRTQSGVLTVLPGSSVEGGALTSSWILSSFQGSKGWEEFDAPWFLSLEKKPKRISLSKEGLLIEYATKDTGYIFSMPLFGYDKLAQEHNNFTAKHGLPSLGIETWRWKSGLPDEVVSRCEWWASVSKAFPVGLDETFSVNPGTDEITFRQDFEWFTLNDDWGTEPRRFAVLPPSVGLAWKFPGFPMEFNQDLHDPEYFTAFGPLVGAIDTDRIEFSMRVLQYVNDLEWLILPRNLGPLQRRALDYIRRGAESKFKSPNRFDFDHGGIENFCWNIVADVWYPRALPFLNDPFKEVVKSSLRIYFSHDVLQPHSPFHGKYILHGPGIGSWGEWGDAGKFMTNALQAIWAYGQFTGDWQLIRNRWDLIRRFFITPEEADWVSFGRYAIAEIGDEAAPCSAYARMAWAVGDEEDYLLGVYMFSRELVHLYVKQRAGEYFYNHQPYNDYEPMPRHIYPTNLWGSTAGWQVDGPVWGKGEHQSANRWVRFHDPDVGRFYRDHLATYVKRELDWYEKEARNPASAIYDAGRYRESLTRDTPHIQPSLLRLRSFLLDEAKARPDMVPRLSGWGASDIAVGYSLLRTATNREYWRIVPKTIPASPFLSLLRRLKREEAVATVQDVDIEGLAIEPRWLGWDMPRGGAHRAKSAARSFGAIKGDFGRRVGGIEGSLRLSYGCRVRWLDSVVPRNLSGSGSNGTGDGEQPVWVAGPFGNTHDSELTETVYPPEVEIDLDATYKGAFGREVSWRRTQLDRSSKISLEPELASPSGEGTLAYAVQFVYSPEDTNVLISVGHQGGVAVWTNGKRILQYHGYHRPAVDDGLLGVSKLIRGWNTILMKVESFTGNYDFRLRLLHPDRQPIPGLRFSERLPASPAAE